LGNLWKPLGDVKDIKANVCASGLIVAGWGYFLIQGVRDPLGGINSLWPLFGIANQLLASIALCLATTVILKMGLQSRAGVPPAQPDEPAPAFGAGSETGAPLRSPALALVTLIPLVWLLTVTMTAGLQKIFDHDSRTDLGKTWTLAPSWFKSVFEHEPHPGYPRVGFLEIASDLENQRLPLEQKLAAAQASADPQVIAAARKALQDNRTLRFNNLLDAYVAAAFLVLVLLIVAISVREWILLLARKRLAALHESDPVWLPEFGVAEGKPLALFSLLALAFALAKELSGEAALERARQTANTCACGAASHHGIDLLGEKDAKNASSKDQLYVETVERRFNGIHRCC
jgi:carbon starvation protein